VNAQPLTLANAYAHLNAHGAAGTKAFINPRGHCSCCNLVLLKRGLTLALATNGIR